MDETTLETSAETVDTTTKQMNPILKKTLIWGGVALGAVAAFLLFKPSKAEDAAHVIIVEESRPADETTVAEVSD